MAPNMVTDAGQEPASLDYARNWEKLPLDERRIFIKNLLGSNSHSQTRQFLGAVRAPKGYGVYASMGPNYQFAVFGRDSLAVAEDVLTIWPELSKEILLLLAQLQGLSYNPINEEEVGKIHHEYRSRDFAGRPISLAAEEVLSALYSKWGGKDGVLCYYGTVDATPSFVCLVDEYCRRFGSDILEEPIAGRDKQLRPFKEHLRLAVQWVHQRVQASPWHLMEFRRLNPDGLYNQAWKDSYDAYLHLDGTLANADSGIASVEVQGLAFDALQAGASLVAANPQEAASWQESAAKVRRQTLDLLWMPDEEFFAMGCDRDAQGKTRQIATLTSSAAELLNSGLLSSLLPDERRKYTAPVARRIMGEDFMTPVGIRLRAVRHTRLVKTTDYHGSRIVWPHETLAVARALRKQGFARDALELEKRTLSAIIEAGEFYEFFLVDRNGKVKYHYREESQKEPAFHLFGSATRPEPGQAWTISAAIRVIDEWHHLKSSPSGH